MRIRRLFGALALAAVTAATALPALPADAAKAPTKSILEIVADSAKNNRGDRLTDRNWNDLDILRAAVIELGLADAVAGLEDATVFAPTDRAFRALVADLTNTSPHDLTEAEVLGVLLDVAGVDDLNGSGVSGATALTETVLYHVSPTKVNLRTQRAPIPTANSVGATEITPRRVLPAVVELVDGDTTDRNPVWHGQSRRATNGAIHIISGVLRPLDLKALFPAD